MSSSCFKKLLRLVVCKTSFYLFIHKGVNLDERVRLYLNMCMHTSTVVRRFVFDDCGDSPHVSEGPAHHATRGSGVIRVVVALSLTRASPSPSTPLTGTPLNLALPGTT